MKTFLLCTLFFPCYLFAQTDTLFNTKLLRIWIYSEGGNVSQGLFAGRLGNDLLVYPNSTSKQQIKNHLGIKSFALEHILTLKTKNPFGWLKGFGYGAAIGVTPIVAGEGGAYVAIISVPVGMITGTIIGATSKKKYRIDKDQEKFLRFSKKNIK